MVLATDAQHKTLQEAAAWIAPKMIEKNNEPFDPEHRLAGVEGTRIKFDAQRMVDGKMRFVKI